MALRFRSLLVVAAMASLALVGACTSAQPGIGPATGSGTVDPGAGAGLGSPLATGIGNHLPSSPGSARLTLSETGSTLIYNLFKTWAGAYKTQYRNITITTAPTGSGAGITAVSAGSANIGASDAFLSSGNLVQDSDLLNIPLAISAQQVNYNLPNLSTNVHLHLDGQVLAGMYQGTITTWNDPAIKKLNPSVSLPKTSVIPLHRAESSGDTFLFTSYLSTYPAWDKTIGYGTTVKWPAASIAPLTPGNGGMVDKCAVTPGCVAYVGISYLTQANQDHLGEAALRNASGSYVLPIQTTMSAAVARLVGVTPANETISMVNGPAPNGYPIVNFEYAIVAADQPKPAVARAIKAFLHWVITTGNSPRFLDQARFQPLPPAIVKLADDQIGEIR